jgi:hypothetical protein
VGKGEAPSNETRSATGGVRRGSCLCLPRYVAFCGLSALCLKRLLEKGVDVPEIETRPNVISWFASKILMETRCDGTKC